MIAIKVIKFCLDRSNSPKKNLDLFGIGALANALSDRKNRQLYREQLALQKQQFETSRSDAFWAEKRARQYALEDFERENEYNSPRNVRARYEAAGLNPALMMQGQNAAVGQMESTSGASPVSPGGMPSIPSHSDFSGGHSFIDVLSVMHDNELKSEQAEQMAIQNEYARSEQISRIRERIANTEKILADSKVSYSQRARLEKQIELDNEELEFLRATRGDRMRSVKWQNNLNIATWKRINSERKKIDTEERILAIEESYRADVIEAGLRHSHAQTKAVSQSIAESVERIEDLTLRRDDDFKTSKELRSRIRKEAREIVVRNLHLEPGTPEYERNVRLIESQIRKNIYDSTSPWRRGDYSLPGAITYGQPGVIRSPGTLHGNGSATSRW